VLLRYHGREASLLHQVAQDSVEDSAVAVVVVFDGSIDAADGGEFDFFAAVMKFLLSRLSWLVRSSGASIRR
jgi:hypothetical protein